MNFHFEVLETFEITGRGLVVVLPVLASDMPHATPLPVTLHVPGQAPFQVQAFHEILLRRTTEVLENSVLLLSGLRKSQVPIGSTLELESNAP
ncbi:hypothetical protein ASD58_06725 [Duganella sp. Root1480D1]|nr:hypothetical protein ASD58_06725 [Duganella sp. Root1480D1]